MVTESKKRRRIVCSLMGAGVSSPGANCQGIVDLWFKGLLEFGEGAIPPVEAKGQVWIEKEAFGEAEK